MHTVFWLESEKEKHHQEDLDVGEMIILRWILREIGLGGVDWINLSQYRSHWRALLKIVMNLRFP
jgi:hypothetical protein